MQPDRGQFRCTSILVANERRPRIYRSLEQLPPRDQSELRKALNSPSAATILIADPAGERYLQQTIRERLHRESQAPPEDLAPFWRGTAWRLTVEFSILAAAGLLLWALATLL